MRSHVHLVLVWLAGVIGLTSIGHAANDIVWIAPHLQNVTADQAVVVWAARQAVSGEVYIKAPSGQIAQFVARTEPLTPGYWLFTVQIQGLKPGTCYEYRVLAGERDLMAPQSTPQFCTAPPPGASFSFAAFGDSGTGLRSQAALATQLMRDHHDGTPLSFIVHAGDIAYPNGTYAQFAAAHFAVYKDLLQLVPTFTTAGNHEYLTDKGEPYRKLHVLPTTGVPSEDAERYYSFDWGDAHIVAFDSGYGSPVSTARFKEWLKRDLASTKARWKIVVFHVAAVSAGKHGASSLTKPLIPIIEAGQVDLVLQAHDHNVQRSLPMRDGKPVGPHEKGVTWVVTGAGSMASYACEQTDWLGYRLCGSQIPVYTRVTVTPQELIVEQVRETGAVLDRFLIQK